MLSRARPTGLVLSLALASLVYAAPATAQTPSPVLRLSELRARLHAYDVGRGGTPEVIRSLGDLARAAPAPAASEARFLRAIATADLLLIARRRRDAALVDRVAAAFGAQAAELDAELRAELEALRHEPYLAAVEDALAALTPHVDLTVPPAEGEHTRRRAVFFARVFDRLLAADDAAEALVELAADPCSSRATCPPPYDHFGERGRRAIAAMSLLHRLLGSLERTARLGDPFAAALAREVLVDTVVLRSISLAPRDWARGVRSIGGLDGQAPLEVDAAVVLSPDRVRAGWIPEVRWGRDGRASLVGDGPLLGSPSEATVPIAAAAEAFVRPIPELGAEVAGVVGGAGRIALMVEPGVEAHLLSRVLVSLDAVRVRPRLLAVASDDGTAHGVEFEAVPDDAGPVGVLVRLGGFSARQRGRHVSLPRRRTGEHWQFDFDGLDLATIERDRHPVTLRYMGTVAADLVLRVALRLASVDRPIRLVLPTAAPRDEG